MIEIDPEDEELIEIDLEDEDPIEDDSEANPEMDHDGKYLEADSEFSPVPGLAPLPAYPLMTDDDWEALYTKYGIGRSGSTMIYEDYPPTPPRRRKRSEAELMEILRQSEMVSAEQ